MRLIWYQRADGFWNAACACNGTLVGVCFERRADGEVSHFAVANVDRTFRAKHPDAYAGNQIPPCGPKLPDPNPNVTTPFVFA